jgi:hypothetical protein
MFITLDKQYITHTLAQMLVMLINSSMPCGIHTLVHMWIQLIKLDMPCGTHMLAHMLVKVNHIKHAKW